MRPAFVRRGTTLDLVEAPWQSAAGNGVLFMLEGSIPELQRLCDRVINGPAGLAYRPADQWILLTIQTIAGFAPQAGGPAYTYDEAALWVAIEDPATGNAAFVLPYVLHERTVPTAVGRELWGFAKESAEISWSASAISGFTGEVDALTWDGGTAAPAFGRLLTVAPGSNWPVTWKSQVDVKLKSLEAGALDLFDQVQLAFVQSVLGIRSHGLEMLMSQHFEFLHLKQSLSADTNGCDLQQVVRMPATMHKLGMAIPSLLRHEVRLGAFQSHPISADLGLPASVDSPLAFQAPFKFALGRATKILP